MLSKPSVVSVKQLLLILLSSIMSITAYGQLSTPAGVPNPTIWFKNSHMPVVQPTSTLVQPTVAGNYQVDSVEHFLNAAENRKTETSDGTWFWVLVPNFTNSVGKDFARFGDVRITDGGVVVQNNSFAYGYTQGVPILLSARYGSSKAHKIHQELLSERGDSSLFEVAEALFYDRVLSEYDRRRVQSYLGFKYSLNVTIEADGLWKDYLAPNGDSLWNSLEDGYFNREVLFLGHDTVSGLYQVQTATNGTEKVVIAVDSLAPIGYQRRSALAVGSNAVFSLRGSRTVGTSVPCHQSTGYKVLWDGWKFKLRDWGSVNDNFQVQVPQALISANAHNPSVVITDDLGGYWFAPVSKSGSNYFFTIDNDSLADNLDYYLCMVDSGVTCLAQSAVYFIGNPDCGNPLDGALYAQVATELLPASLSLSHNSGSTVTYVLSEQYTSIQGLSSGHYYVIITSDGKQELFYSQSIGTKGECPTTEHWVVYSEQTSDEQISQNTPVSLAFYPNPALAGTPISFSLEGVGQSKQIAIAIYSSSGNLVGTRVLPSNSTSWTEVFDSSGSFIVEVTVGDKHLLSATVLIQE